MKEFFFRQFLILFISGLFACNISIPDAAANFTKICEPYTELEDVEMVIVGQAQGALLDISSRWLGNDQKHFFYESSDEVNKIMVDAIERAIENPPLPLSKKIDVISEDDFFASKWSDLKRTIFIGYGYNLNNIDDTHDVVRIDVYTSGPYTENNTNFPYRFSKDIEVQVPFAEKPSREEVISILKTHFRNSFFRVCKD